MVKLNDPWAKVKGYCPSVPAAMQRHLLLVAPLRYGAGVKGKAAENSPLDVTGDRSSGLKKHKKQL